MRQATDNPNELFIIVDKNDNITGYSTRGECHRNKNLIHRAIHVVILNGKDEVLLQKRSKHKDMQPGYYCVSVGGHVTKGESYQTTAKRELKEELGITTPIRQIKKYLASVSDQTEMVTVYQAVHEGPFKIKKDEIELVQFYSKRQLKKDNLPITPISLLTLKQLKLL